MTAAYGAGDADRRSNREIARSAGGSRRHDALHKDHKRQVRTSDSSRNISGTLGEAAGNDEQQYRVDVQQGLTRIPQVCRGG